MFFFQPEQKQREDDDESLQLYIPGQLADTSYKERLYESFPLIFLPHRKPLKN